MAEMTREEMMEYLDKEITDTDQQINEMCAAIAAKPIARDLERNTALYGLAEAIGYRMDYIRIYGDLKFGDKAPEDFVGIELFAKLFGKAAPGLSTAQAAEALGLTDARIRQLCASGELGAQKVGRDWLIQADEVERYKQQGERHRPKYGDKRPDRVATQLFLTRMTTVASETGGYDIQGYWDDLTFYQGKETYFKLSCLKPHIAAKTYDRLLAILKEDDAQNPLAK